jgi:hypothetical protein
MIVPFDPQIHPVFSLRKNSRVKLFKVPLLICIQPLCEKIFECDNINISIENTIALMMTSINSILLWLQYFRPYAIGLPVSGQMSRHHNKTVSFDY